MHRPTTLLLAGLGLTLSATAFAQPAQIILLRHGEKKSASELCDIGIQRSQALVGEYLGQGATNSLFAAGTGPAAFLGITLHTLELAAPAAASWNLPVITFASVPGIKSPGTGKKDAKADKKAGKDAQTLQLNQLTQNAAAYVLTNAAFSGKTVVMVWEHDHIASSKLAQKYTQSPVTLRQLLHLDQLQGVPTDWSGSNYDYFWIVRYGNPGSPIPTAFQSVQQVFSGAFASVPSNAWGTPENLPANSGCKQ